MTKFRETRHVLTIGASRDKVWEATFDRFGDVNDFNGLIQDSHYINGSEKGELGCERQCHLDDKTHVLERISRVDPGQSFDIEIYDGNMPVVGPAVATLNLKSLGAEQTEIEFIMRYSTKPAFMARFMKGQMTKMVTKILIGLKYNLETGGLVTKENYPQIDRQFKLLRTDEKFTVPIELAA